MSRTFRRVSWNPDSEKKAGRDGARIDKLLKLDDEYSGPGGDAWNRKAKAWAKRRANKHNRRLHNQLDVNAE